MPQSRYGPASTTHTLSSTVRIATGTMDIFWPSSRRSGRPIAHPPAPVYNITRLYENLRLKGSRVYSEFCDALCLRQVASPTWSKLNTTCGQERTSSARRWAARQTSIQLKFILVNYFKLRIL